MHFRVETEIAKSPQFVFELLRDIDQEVRDPRSVVPVLEKLTPGPCAVGSRYREVVRVLPFANAEIISEVDWLEPPRVLGYRFTWRLLGARMSGTLRYHFEGSPAGTHLVQEQTLVPAGLLRAFSPVIRRMFGARLRRRILEVKRAAEAASGAPARPAPPMGPRPEPPAEQRGLS